MFNQLLPKMRDILFTRVYNDTCQAKLMRSLDDIFDNSLQTDTEMRDLDMMILLLESDEILW